MGAEQKTSICISTFNSHKPLKNQISLPTFYRIRDWHTEGLSVLSQTHSAKRSEPGLKARSTQRHHLCLLSTPVSCGISTSGLSLSQPPHQSWQNIENYYICREHILALRAEHCRGLGWSSLKSEIKRWTQLYLRSLTELWIPVLHCPTFHFKSLLMRSMCNLE